MINIKARLLSLSVQIFLHYQNRQGTELTDEFIICIHSLIVNRLSRGEIASEETCTQLMVGTKLVPTSKTFI